MKTKTMTPTELLNSSEYYYEKALEMANGCEKTAQELIETSEYLYNMSEEELN